MKNTTYTILAAGLLLFAATSCSEEKEGGYYSDAISSQEQVNPVTIRGYTMPGTAGRKTEASASEDVPGDELVRRYYNDKPDLAMQNPLYGNTNTRGAATIAGGGATAPTDSTNTTGAGNVGTPEGSGNINVDNTQQNGQQNRSNTQNPEQ